MARDCKLFGFKALYQDCLECSYRRRCKMEKKYKLSCVGIDQSYKRTGISVSCDGTLKLVRSYDLHKMSKHDARDKVAWQTNAAVTSALSKSEHVVVLLERIRLFSQQFISMPYILSMGMMNGAVYDNIADNFDDCLKSGKLEVMTVETRAWKKAVVGTTKGAANDYGVPENKWPSVMWLSDNYPQFESSFLHESKSKKKTKSNFEIDGCFYEYDDDAVDSACISLFPFSCPDWSSKLEAIE